MENQLNIVKTHHYVTGARSRELPNLPQDGKKILGYRDLSLTPAPKKW